MDSEVPGIFKTSFDSNDYEVLARAVFSQAWTDYIKLQHPRSRKKNHAREAFLDAVDMFFDETYLFMCFKDELENHMNLEDLLRIFYRGKTFDVSLLQERLAEEAVAYWEKKRMRTIEIPEQVVVHGYVFEVILGDVESFLIDFDERTITLDFQLDKLEKQKQFARALMRCVAYYEGGKYPGQFLDKLSDRWLAMLKVNNCFTGA